MENLVSKLGLRPVVRSARPPLQHTRKAHAARAFLHGVKTVGRILSCCYLQSIEVKVPFDYFMNSFTIDISHRDTHVHTSTLPGNGCFGFFEEHSMLKALVVLDISKHPLAFL